MTYIDCWNSIKDLRWLIFLIYNNDRLRENYELKASLRNFTISLAEEINEMSGKEKMFFEDVKYTMCVEMVTGLEGSVISNKRKLYFNRIANEPVKVRNILEYNLYFSVLDANCFRAAYNSYIRAIYFIENYTEGNISVVNDFKTRINEEFKKSVECKINVDDKYKLQPGKILQMYMHGIYPEFSYDLVYTDSRDCSGENSTEFYELWNNENDIRWLLYYVLKVNKTDENKLRQFTLDTLMKVISRCNADNYIHYFRDDINLIQDSIYGIVRKEAVAASGRKDNYYFYNTFSYMWNRINGAVNALKFEDAASAVMFAFHFIIQAIESFSTADKGFYNRMNSEIISDFKKTFENPFAEFEFVNFNHKSIKCLKSYHFLPTREENKWYFRPDNFIKTK